jgi:hypothetical protein
MDLINYTITPFVIVGAFPLVSEINQSSKPFFAKNQVKWIVLWGIFYSKIADVRYATAASILVMMIYPSIFFGKTTYYEDIK